MAKINIKLEIDESSYQSFKNNFEKLKASFPQLPYATVEEYIASFLDQFTKYGGKMDDISEKIEKQFNEIIKNTGIDLGDIASMFGSKSETKKEEEKEKDENKNLD
jgi:flavodoxin